jgi:enoyl-CoA hydratase
LHGWVSAAGAFWLGWAVTTLLLARGLPIGENERVSFARIRYDVPAPRVGRITLARADKHNAQDELMLRELDVAFDAAVADADIGVIVVAADGANFSAGHDLTGFGEMFATDPQAHLEAEEELFIGYCWKWRNLPKPTIAQVQGKVIAGGLMLVWPCDLVIASEDAEFSDPVVAFGVNGHEYFVHAWELGHRTAKEMLFRGRPLSARECHRRGAVNHVVARGELEAFTLAIAAEIAQRPAVGLRLAKQAVNESLDAQGQWTALRAAFALHHEGHLRARVEHGQPIDPAGIELIRGLAQR